MSYAYIAGTNKLQSVTDAVNTTTEDWDAEDTEFGYDGNGNVTTMLENEVPAISSIQYDHRNLPVSLVNRNGDLVIYKYNASGQRIYKKVGSQTPEYYIMDGDQTVAVFENGAVKYWNLLANDVAGRYEPGSGSKFYYLKDHLGSTRAVVYGNGTVKEALDYYPFGLLMPGRAYQLGSDTKEKFTGKERDSETGLDYFGTRYYWAAGGRWWSVDISADNYPAWSPFHYTFNNPIIFVDLFGTDIYFYNSDSTVIATIVTGSDEHQYIYTGLDYTTDNPIVVDIAKLLEQTGLSEIDAVGISFTGDFAFGGGLGGGTEFVYFLSGVNEGEIHQYNMFQATIGYGIGGGATAFGALYKGKGTPTAESWAGWTNSYSLSLGVVEGNYFWSNEKGVTDLWPEMYGRPTLWKGFSFGGVYSGKIKVGAMWKTTKYTHRKKW